MDRAFEENLYGDEAYEVGRRESVDTSEFTRIEMRKAGGPLMYSREDVDIEEEFVPKNETYGDNQQASFFQWEFKVDRKTGEAKKGDQVIITKDPYNNGFIYSASFKGRYGDKKRKPNPFGVDSETGDFKLKTTEEYLRWRNNLRNDLDENDDRLTAGINADWLTAVISTPEHPLVPRGIEYNTRSTQTVYGLCPAKLGGVGGCVKNLYYSRLIEDKLKGSNNHPFKTVHTAEGPIPFFLHDETQIDKDGIMICSIYQALAGPFKNTEEWREKSVADTAIAIYDLHLDGRHNQEKKYQEFFFYGEKYWPFIDDYPDL